MVPKGITILLAEDEPQIRDLLTMIFEGEGYSLLVASDGEEALLIGRAYAGRVDLLVSDVQMQGMSGPELAKQLRHSRPDLRALENDWHFLQKPFMPSTILAEVNELLRNPPTT